MIEYLQKFGGYTSTGLTIDEKKELESLRLQVKKYRALEEEQQLTETLFQFLTSMTMREIKLKDEELLFESCQQFIGLWWQEGYEKGERRYRLKLH